MSEITFDLTAAQKAEALRRCRLLGSLADVLEPNAQQVYNWSRVTGIPNTILQTWCSAYQSDGLKGLEPAHWQELSKKDEQLALERYDAIIPFADLETIESYSKITATIATKSNVSETTAWRWLKRYRIGGLWGLTSSYNPLSPKKQEQPPPRDLGSLEEEELTRVYERYEKLGHLVNLVDASKKRTRWKMITDRAAEVDETPETLWRWLKSYIQFGMPGLANKPCVSKKCQLDERMQKIILALHYKYPLVPVTKIHNMAMAIAIQIGEEIPGESQVRKLIEDLPEPLRMLATGNEKQFRDSYQITYKIQFDGIVYQIDHTLIDLLVLDKRQARHRNKSGETRLWLTIVIEARSRCILAFRLAYDAPNSYTVAAVIRDSILNYPGGIPDEIWVDNGKDLVSNHVIAIAKDLGFHLHVCTPGQPQHRGIGERFFGTLNTRLWSILPGYTSSNVQERPPNIKAVLTPDEIVTELTEHINKYNNETHSQLQTSPNEYWKHNCFAPPFEDKRQLDILLMKRFTRKVTKKGISFNNKFFWHIDLGPYVGQEVLIRVDDEYTTQDEIEVFHNGQWICSAFSANSTKGKNVSPAEIKKAKKRQRKVFRDQVREAKQMLAEIDATPSTRPQKAKSAKKTKNSSIEKSIPTPFTGSSIEVLSQLHNLLPEIDE